MTQTTSTLTKKVLIGAGVTAAATVGAYTPPNLLFSFALDTQARRSMMRRLQDGELEDPQPETPAADMAEQEEKRLFAYANPFSDNLLLYAALYNRSIDTLIYHAAPSSVIVFFSDAEV